MNLNISTGTVFNRVALVCGAISICIGGMGLAGWASGLRVLAGVRLDYIPMAPNTALIVILLGCALFSGIAWPGNCTIRMAIAGVSVFCILVAGLTLIGIVTGIDLKTDYLLLTTTGTIGAIPVGRMSPVTAICVLSGCAALLLLLFRKRDLSALLGTVIALVSGMMIIGYWYGAPLLYGGTVIPVALTTAVALGVLGVGLNAAAGPDSWPLSSVTGSSTRARLLRGLLPVILLLVLTVNWINAVISGPADSSIVLLSAMTGILSLLVVYVVVTYLSREIGDAIDRSEEKRKLAEGALHESEEKYQVSYEQLAITEEELREQYSELAKKDEAIEVLNQDLEKRVEERTSELRKTNEALNASETRYRRLFEAAQDGILILDAETGQIVDVNPFLIHMLGYSHEQFLGKKIWEIGFFKDIVANKDNFIELQRQEYIRYEDLPLETADGRHIAVEFVSNVYVVNHTKVIQCNIRDITDRKKMTEQIEASLAEKEILLKEVHHRVKNNLQIIASLLNLQIRKINDPATIETLKDCQNRVRSMALVHEHLYRGKDFSHVDLGNYIRALGTVLFNSSEAGNRGVRFDLGIHDIYVDTNTAIPLGLISNELITNSIKYAFNEKKDGKLSITATEDPVALTFIVADNGAGLAPDISLENQTSLGFQLVSSLTDQLNGMVTIERTEGTKFTFTFPKPAEQKPPGGAGK